MADRKPTMSTGVADEIKRENANLKIQYDDLAEGRKLWHELAVELRKVCPLTSAMEVRPPGGSDNAKAFFFAHWNLLELVCTRTTQGQQAFDDCIAATLKDIEGLYRNLEAENLKRLKQSGVKR